MEDINDLFVNQIDELYGLAIRLQAETRPQARAMLKEDLSVMARLLQHTARRGDEPASPFGMNMP